MGRRLRRNQKTFIFFKDSVGQDSAKKGEAKLSAWKGDEDNLR